MSSFMRQMKDAGFIFYFLAVFDVLIIARVLFLLLGIQQ